MHLQKDNVTTLALLLKPLVYTFTTVGVLLDTHSAQDDPSKITVEFYN